MKERRSNPRGQGGRLRQELLLATRRLADRSGTTEGLSIRAIAKEVGVAAPSIYLHFRDRDDIFRAAVSEDYRALASDLRRGLEGVDSSPLERLRAIGRAYCKFAVAHPGRYRMITEVQQTSSRAKRSHDGHPAAEVQSILQTAILECQRRGLGATLDPDLLLTCLWSGWHGFIELRRSKPLREWPDLNVVVDTLVNRLVR